MSEASVRVSPTFQHQHHIGIASSRAAAARGLVSLKQLVHLPLDLRGARVAVAFGDGEPLAHGGCRPCDTRRFFSLQPLLGRTNTNTFLNYFQSPLSQTTKFTTNLAFLDRKPLFSRFIRRAVRSGPSHQPVSAGLLRTWVLKPYNAAYRCAFLKI